MLSQLLPGVRHIRAPLLAGYLWFGALWLLLWRQFPSAEDLPDQYPAFESLHNYIGDIGVAAGIGIAVYFVASLSLLASKISLGQFWFFRDIRGMGPADISQRLLVESPAIFGEYDRHYAEWELRIGALPPLAVLIGAIVVNVNWGFRDELSLIGAGVTVWGLLLWQAFVSFREAYWIMEGAVRAGALESR